MSVLEEYLQQSRFRNWSRYLEVLPLRKEDLILDLGAGPGIVANLFGEKVRRVLAIDRDPELLEYARSKARENVKFLRGDIAELDQLPMQPASYDGIWASFMPAYFPDLTKELRRWAKLLKPGGWIALVEVDDMFLGQEPLSDFAREGLLRFEKRLLKEGPYDFHMGAKLAPALTAAGFRVENALQMPDDEFCFQGPASPAVRKAWEKRLLRLRTLVDTLSDDAARVRDEFLECLSHPKHRSHARVYYVWARLREDS